MSTALPSLLSTLTYPTELHTALHAVHLASLLTKAHLLRHLSRNNSSGAGVTASTKSDNSEVTVADFASQAIIISIIHAAFPEDVFIAEESGGMLRRDEELRGRVWGLVKGVSELKGRYQGAKESDGTNSIGKVELKLPESEEEMVAMIDLGQVGGRNANTNGSGDDDAREQNRKRPRTWILDPIDGTKTYIRGQQYVVCLCLVDHDEQQVAVMGCPNLNIDTKDSEGRVIVQEGLVDSAGDGGWIVSCVKGEGVALSRMREPFELRFAGDVLGWEDSNGSSSIDNDNETTLTKKPTKVEEDGNRDFTLRFTDSTASPHVSMDLHSRVFTHFSPKSTSPASPLNIWSMQLKFILLALRVSGADAMIRVPPDENYHASVWDHAGGQLLVRESGGVLSDANGVTFVLDGRTRKLVGNWGVVAIRGGGSRWEGKSAHRVVLERVKGEVEERKRRKEESVGGR